MKTSLNELQLIEDFLLADPAGEEKILMQARQILQPGLQESIHWQQKTYRLVNAYGREQLKQEISRVHQMLFTAGEHLSFQQKVLHFFNK